MAARQMIGWTEKPADVRARPIEERESVTQVTSINVDALSEQPTLIWHESCCKAVLEHVSRENYEQGGLLLGYAWHASHDAARILLIDVIDAVEAPVAQGTAVSLYMGTELWNLAHERAQGDAHIVGWYHSHPGLGAFFSGVDKTTQAAFFREPWHVALVVDPLAGTVAWFRGELSESCNEAAVLLA